MPRDVRVGIIGWNYPEWRGLAYAKAAKPPEFLGLYAAKFGTVESAASYYRVPDAKDVAAIDAATPRGFSVSFKVPDWIVRAPDDLETPEKIAVLRERLAPLGKSKKLGALVAQFPPNFKREKRAASLEAFVRALPKGEAWAVELRDPSWWHEDTYALLKKAKVTLVWSAVESGRTPPVVTSDRLYLRLFGDKSLEKPWDRKRRDQRKELAHWAERIEEEGAKAKRVDVMVSKFLEGYAPGSAATMCELLGLPVPDVGPRTGKAA